MATIKNTKSVLIQVDPANVENFKRWCWFYRMKVKKKTGFNWEVSNYEDADLYWLGLNMGMDASLKLKSMRRKF